jgi:hypothetical protein
MGAGDDRQEHEGDRQEHEGDRAAAEHTEGHQERRDGCNPMLPVEVACQPENGVGTDRWVRHRPMVRAYDADPGPAGVASLAALVVVVVAAEWEHECRLKQTCPLDSDIGWNEGAFLVSSVNITGPSMPVIYSFVFSWSAAACCAIDPTLSLSRTLSIGPIWLSLVTRQHECWPDLPDPSVLQPVWVVSHPACQPAPWCNPSGLSHILLANPPHGATGHL